VSRPVDKLRLHASLLPRATDLVTYKVWHERRCIGSNWFGVSSHLAVEAGATQRRPPGVRAPMRAPHRGRCKRTARSKLGSGRNLRLVRHTGIAANVRRVPAEYGCYGRLRPAPVGPDRLEGTDEGTKTASTKRLLP
jgi:hypothetical protein